MVENVRSGKPLPVGAILRKSGYRELANQPSRVLDSKGFQDLLGTIDDGVIINRLYEIVRDEDKRAIIAASHEILTLKDRYPAQKNKIIGLFENITSIEE